MYIPTREHVDTEVSISYICVCLFFCICLHVRQYVPYPAPFRQLTHPSKGSGGQRSHIYLCSALLLLLLLRNEAQQQQQQQQQQQRLLLRCIYSGGVCPQWRCFRSFLSILNAAGRHKRTHLHKEAHQLHFESAAGAADPDDDAVIGIDAAVAAAAAAVVGRDCASVLRLC